MKNNSLSLTYVNKPQWFLRKLKCVCVTREIIRHWLFCVKQSRLCSVYLQTRIYVYNVFMNVFWTIKVLLGWTEERLLLIIHLTTCWKLWRTVRDFTTQRLICCRHTHTLITSTDHALWVKCSLLCLAAISVCSNTINITARGIQYRKFKTEMSCSFETNHFPRTSTKSTFNLHLWHPSSTSGI